MTLQQTVMKYAAQVGFVIGEGDPSDETLARGVVALHDTTEIMHGLEHPIARIRPDNTLQFLNNAFLRYAEVDEMDDISPERLRAEYYNGRLTDRICDDEHERFERAKAAVKERRLTRPEAGRHMLGIAAEFTFVSYKGTETPMRASMTYSVNYDTYQISFTDIRDLQESQRGLQSAKAELEQRAADLADANERLRREAEDRAEVIAQLRDALANISTLEGLIPICAWCKKVRDDDGYWTQVETYFGERSEAEFSHGICPGCAAKVGEEAAQLRDGNRSGLGEVPLNK
jgi:hypothetical protein